jgi:hypothetical protein
MCRAVVSSWELGCSPFSMALGLEGKVEREGRRTLHVTLQMCSSAVMLTNKIKSKGVGRLCVGT